MVLCKAVIVGGKHPQAADILDHVGEHGCGDGCTVAGGSASAELVEDHQGPGSGSPGDGGIGAGQRLAWGEETME